MTRLCQLTPSEAYCVLVEQLGHLSVKYRDLGMKEVSDEFAALAPLIADLWASQQTPPPTTRLT